MARRCRELLAERVEVVSEADQGTLVAFRTAGEAPATAKRAYEQSVIIRDLPGTGLLRASCGYWTSDEDLERLVVAVSG
jgi:selenocysteine lyase/cysteine desulfurase